MNPDPGKSFIDFNILLYFILDRDQHLVIFMLQIKRFPVQIPDLCDRRACRSDNLKLWIGTDRFSKNLQIVGSFFRSASSSLIIKIAIKCAEGGYPIRERNFISCSKKAS